MLALLSKLAALCTRPKRIGRLFSSQRTSPMSDQSREASTLQNTVAFLSIALAVVLLFYASHGT
jgi:hypothetical protein